MSRINFVTSVKDGLTLDQIREAAPSVFNLDKHESRSARYHVAPTVEVLEQFMADDFKVVLAGQQRSRTHDKTLFTRHVLRLRKNGIHSVNDCFPEVILTNSHDGSSSYRLFFGLFRSICQTQLSVGDATIAGQKVTHSAKDTATKVVEGANDVLARTPELQAAMAAWRNTTLTAKEQEVFAKQALALHYGKRVPPITEQQALAAAYWEDAGDDLWNTFLRVQKNLTTGGIIYNRSGGKHTKGTTRGIRGIHRSLQFNRGLWDLAQATHDISAV
jgi:hypothetical protein